MVEGGSRWTSRSIGSNFQHRIFYALIRWGGRRAAYALLYPVVAWYVLCRPLVRARCRPYLEHRFPARRGWRRLLDSFRMSLALGKSLVDRAVVGILRPEAMRPAVEGREELLRLAQEEKGLILLVAHVGCWQAAMSALRFLGRPVSMLMQREEGDVDRHWFEHAGVACPYRIIDPRGFLGGALELLEVLKNGEVLSVMGDRLLGNDRNAVTVEFLGGPVRLPYSVYQLASATGAPIAVLLPHKSGPDRYAMRLYEVIRVPSAGPRRRPL
jgi:predicted LPLAT superfamily acyltransferase